MSEISLLKIRVTAILMRKVINDQNILKCQTKADFSDLLFFEM